MHKTVYKSVCICIISQNYLKNMVILGYFIDTSHHSGPKLGSFQVHAKQVLAMEPSNDMDLSTIQKNSYMMMFLEQLYGD